MLTFFLLEALNYKLIRVYLDFKLEFAYFLMYHII